MVNNQNEPSFVHENSVGYVQKALGLSNVSDCSRCDVFGISGEELTLSNFKDNGKRFYCDDNPDNAGCKRAKQINNMDSFQASPPSDEVACSGRYDLPWENLGSPIWEPVFSDFCGYQTVTRCSKVKEICPPIHEPSPVHEHLGHKPIPIGPNHQAVIPDWQTPSVNNNDTNSEKWIKYCVSPSHNLDPFLSRNICCECPDEGSTRCVRKHITESREDLRKVFGQEKFEKLGFCNMGEEVALKWTAEEEKLFQEVVSQSMDKNFWDDLPCAFPNKSSKDLVSYYFNVFILRKRDGQNRWDPTHINSDDDEWEEPESKSQVDEQDEEEEQEREQEEDEEENESDIESLSGRDDFMCNNDCVREDHSEQSTEDDIYQNPIVGENKEGHYFDFGILNEDGNTDSCTSFDENFHCVDAINGFGVVSHDGIFDDLKVWDIDFPNRNRVDDFLSTCNVVDEFVGMEPWDNCDIGRDESF